MCRMWPHLVVVALPRSQHGTSLPQRDEQRLVPAFVAQPAAKTLSERVLLWLARRDVVPVHLALLAPGQDGIAGQFGAVVTDAQQRSCTTTGDDCCQLTSNAFA